MTSTTMIGYFAAICGVLAMVAPILQSPVTRFVFGTVLGVIAVTTWPAAKLLFG